MTIEDVNKLKTSNEQTSAPENPDSKSISPAKTTSFSNETRTSPDVVKIQDDDPIAGTGLFAHGCEETIPYALLLTRLYMQRNYYPTLNTYHEVMSTQLKPHIVLIGRKRTIFANFKEFSRGFEKDMRNKHHFLLSITKQLGTSGVLHPRDIVVMKGRFTQAQIGKVIDFYNRTYVLCSNCESRNTLLWREERRGWFNTCQTCLVEYSVPSVSFVCRLTIPVSRKKPTPAPQKEEKTDIVPESILDMKLRILRKPEIKSKL